MHDAGGRADGRRFSPDQMLARIRPRLAPEFGVTRLAEQTGLDVIGIPTVSAIRPNGMMVSAHQGKGVDLDQALVSAAMEALEVAVAERPRSPDWLGPRGDDRAALRTRFRGGRLSRPDYEGRWLHGTGLEDHATVLVPAGIIAYCDPNPGFVQTTNGLASGGSLAEALEHAICELVEIDAEALFSIRPDYRRFDPVATGDATVAALADLIQTAGLALTVLDLTTDIGLPVVMAVISGDGAAPFPATYGLGCGLSPAAATKAAILEAAQSRVTNIAGSRDDCLPGEYSRPKAVRTDWQGLPVTACPPSVGFAMPSTPDARVSAIAQLVLAQGCDLTMVVLHTDEDFSVVRVLSDALEDRSVNPLWRPGARAFSRVRLAA